MVQPEDQNIGLHYFTFRDEAKLAFDLRLQCLERATGLLGDKVKLARWHLIWKNRPRPASPIVSRQHNRNSGQADANHRIRLSH